MFIERGLNDKWVRPQRIRRTAAGHYTVALQETLGQAWENELVSYPFPAGENMAIRVLSDGKPVPCQQSAGRLSLLIDALAPGERKVFAITVAARDEDKETGITEGVHIAWTPWQVVLGNGLLTISLPASNAALPLGEAASGPLLGARAGNGPSLGKGRLESPLTVLSVETRVAECGALWTAMEVVYTFERGYTYTTRFTMRPALPFCEVREESTLPVRLWPAPRPYREIGSLAASHWNQGIENIARPCTRPCPSSNFIFDLREGFQPDRLITHSTASWEIMDLPLGAAALKTYTALRPALPSIDGSWLGIYDSSTDEILGFATQDICHWGIPDDVLHPAHRTVGANTEVILVDSAEDGAYLRFPIENLTRRWLLAVASRQQSLGESAALDRKPLRREADYGFPLWALHTRQSALRLDKVKEWVTEWPEAGDEHPRLFCRPADFPAIREKVRATPELWQCYQQTGATHSADRFMLEGELVGLAAIEEATHGKELVEGILARGYIGPSYCIGLARPLRRYAVACDMQWAAFTPEERREARRVCALAAYILTDGDWWQYVFRPGETTYLPNFNSDVFTCAGIIGLFLTDHPCAKLWVDYLVQRMDLELKTHLRPDGGGEENVGNYLLSTWQMLYLPALWALRQNRIKDYSTDKNVLGGARFLLKALGPPDARDGGLRQLPPIGHHPYARKAPPLFAWLAAFLKDADPALAGNMMWAWREVGSPVYQNYDHSGPQAEPFTRHYVFHDPTIPAVSPALSSENFPHVGAVLRSHDAGGQGSYLFLKAGRVHSHHDDDEGSFHYYGRGVPLALDGLPLQNGATAAQHNAVTFALPGQPSGFVECFVTTPGADYLRARIAPRAFPCDAMYVDGTHRSGFTREIVMVKSALPGGVEYLVLKDTACGPEACQWNLDVLSRQPALLAENNIRFPGHPDAGFGMGLDVIILEPNSPHVFFEAGVVNPALATAETRAALSPIALTWTVNEHWLLHVNAAPGATFLTVLFPRRDNEPAPQTDYCAREETLSIRHADGRDLLFLRPNTAVGANIAGIRFQGRAGLASRRDGRWQLFPFEAKMMALQDEEPAALKFL